jgi:hypothetical protein
VPVISRFFGILITMYYDDHLPEHFHAKYAEHWTKVAIETLELIEGRLPRRALALVLEWASLHREELRVNWQRARGGLPLQPIDPLE